jgi:mRNA interferase HigB
LAVRIISRGKLRDFWQASEDSEQPLKSWYQEVKKADWKAPHDVKAMYGNASVIGHSRIVFNIGGNKYRLIVEFNYNRQIAFIRFIDTHAAYDKVEAETVR